jgi:hypothetical protein
MNWAKKWVVLNKPKASEKDADFVEEKNLGKKLGYCIKDTQGYLRVRFVETNARYTLDKAMFKPLVYLVIAGVLLLIVVLTALNLSAYHLGLRGNDLVFLSLGGFIGYLLMALPSTTGRAVFQRLVNAIQQRKTDPI